MCAGADDAIHGMALCKCQEDLGRRLFDHSLHFHASFLNCRTKL